MTTPTDKNRERYPNALKSVDKAVIKPKSLSRRGPIWKITVPYREWRQLPINIRRFPLLTRKNARRILNGLIDYRLALVTSQHKANNIDFRIWSLYYQTRNEYSKLDKESKSRFLFLKSLRFLRKLQQSWENLISKQEELLDAIERAPASIKFYNMMMAYKETHQKERLEDEENQRKFSEAYNSLELALDYVEEFFHRNTNEIFQNSEVLKIEDARQSWAEKLTEINNLHQSKKSSIEEIISKIDALKNVVFEIPTMAKWIHDLELRFWRLESDHKLLNSAYGKNIIHLDELNETKTLLQEVIPKLWITGEGEKLDYYLNQLDRFLKNHESTIQLELSFEERHSPWTQTEQSVTAGENGELDMLISFMKIMINAIESREPHMGDHSVTVARLCVEIAKQLEWIETDIKYLELAALLHDIGKIWIPESLLTKKEPLTENEVQVVQMHPYYSAKIVESIEALKKIVPWVYYHHERWDGKGYPDGLYHQEIPQASSILSVAEACSAMIFNTLSREPISIREAMEQIHEGSGYQFDPEVVKAIDVVINSIGFKLIDEETASLN
ncbi:MAG: HD domain-containing protein [Anaerolineaceae bacterium]|nr:HD domain-containing protein [Anaerolineaceae bacterium]